MIHLINFLKEIRTLDAIIVEENGRPCFSLRHLRDNDCDGLIHFVNYTEKLISLRQKALDDDRTSLDPLELERVNKSFERVWQLLETYYENEEKLKDYDIVDILRRWHLASKDQPEEEKTIALIAWDRHLWDFKNNIFLGTEFFTLFHHNPRITLELQKGHRIAVTDEFIQDLSAIQEAKESVFSILIPADAAKKEPSGQVLGKLLAITRNKDIDDPSEEDVKKWLTDLGYNIKKAHSVYNKFRSVVSYGGEDINMISYRPHLEEMKVLIQNVHPQFEQHLTAIDAYLEKAKSQPKKKKA